MKWHYRRVQYFFDQPCWQAILLDGCLVHRLQTFGTWEAGWRWIWTEGVKEIIWIVEPVSS